MLCGATNHAPDFTNIADVSQKRRPGNEFERPNVGNTMELPRHNLTRLARWLASATALSLLCFAATACGDDDDGGDTTPSPTSAVTQPGSSPTKPPVTATSQPTTQPTEAPPAVQPCATSDLALSQESAGAAAGTHFLSLVLTNTSGAECTLRGFPGVSLIDAGGNQVGEPAERNDAIDPTLVTLQPGEAAHATVGFPNYQNFPAGNCEGPSASIKLYPPDELTALVINEVDYSCPGFSVQVIQPGRNEPGRS